MLDIIVLKPLGQRRLCWFVYIDCLYPLGYEIRGIENMPAGACLVIYYHGALPIDMYYFTARMYLRNKRMIHTVGDRFMFRIPGE